VTIVHEVMHIVGLSSSHYSKAIDASGNFISDS